MPGEDVEVAFAADFRNAVESLDDFVNGLHDRFNTAQNDIEQRSDFLATTLAVAAGNILSSAIQGAMGAISKAFDTVKGHISGFVEAAAEAEAVQKKLEIAVRNAGPAFGFTAEQLAEAASALQDVSVFGDEAIKDAQRMLIQFRLTGATFKDAQQVAVDMASALGQDVAQAASTVGRALAAPERAALMLRRAGIVLTEQQREQIKIFQASGQAAKAQGVILEELQKRFAGAGLEVQATAQGGWKAFLEVVGDIKEELGNAFLPIIKAILPVLKEMALAVKDWAHDLQEAFNNDSGKQWAEAFRDAIIDMAAVVTTLIEELIAKFSRLRLKYLEYKEGVVASGFGTGLSGLGFGGGGADPKELAQLRKEQEDIINSLPVGSFDARVGRRRQDFEKFLTPGKRPSASDILGEGATAPIQEPDYLKFFQEAAAGVKTAFTLAAPKVVDFLKENVVPPNIDEIVAGIKQKEKEFDAKPFQGGFEDAASTFRRIQAARSSGEDVPKQQLSALEKQIVKMQEQKEAQDLGNKSLGELVVMFQRGLLARAGP